MRSRNEGPVVFATDNEIEASKFIVPSDDSWSQLSRFNDIHVAIYSDRSRFFRNDKGGAIYTLPSDTFSIDQKFSGSSKEWTSKENVKPIEKIEYASGFKCMLTKGVQVYFVSEEILKEIQKAEDHGYSLIKKLTSENTKLNKKVKKLS
ncbi:MAG: hypothetical protein ACMG6E_04210 [Candidatus Roizmanbacteria bacterium]